MLATICWKIVLFILLLLMKMYEHQLHSTAPVGDYSSILHLVQSHNFCSCVSVKSAKLLSPSQSIWNLCSNTDKGNDILDSEKSWQILSDFPPRLGRVLENISIPASWYLLPPLPCPIEAGLWHGKYLNKQLMSGVWHPCHLSIR